MAFSIFHDTVKNPVPPELRIGMAYQFDESVILPKGLQTLFTYPGTNHIVIAVGRTKISGYEVANVYLREEETGVESFLRLTYDKFNGRLENVKLFVNYDTIYPADEGEWRFWLGDRYNNYSQGIIGDREFYITRTVDDVIKDTLVKVVSTEFPQFCGWDNAQIGDEGDYFVTDIAILVSQELGILLENVYDTIMRRLANVPWIEEAIIEDSDALTIYINKDFYDDFEERTFKYSYQNLYGVNKLIYDEVVYNNPNNNNHVDTKGFFGIYSREIIDDKFRVEYLFVSSKDTRNGACISIDIGIDLPLQSLRLSY